MFFLVLDTCLMASLALRLLCPTDAYKPVASLWNIRIITLGRAVFRTKLQ